MTQPGLPATWQAICDAIRGQVNSQQYETWFRKVRPLSIEAQLVRIGVPSAFLKEWLQNYYIDVIRNAIEQVTGTHPILEIVIEESHEEDLPPPVSTGAGTPQTAQSGPVWSHSVRSDTEGGLRASRKYPNFLSDVLLNDNYTFDNFVVGPGNKLPHAAALAVADKPSIAYNPLFLHGSVGLGKTHLLQAVCHSLLSQRNDLKILYLSCETFTNQFISAVKKGDLRNFRYRYRHVDLLLIDDIHFLAKKEQTQEEFFHTFNTLHNSGKQIVLSSDSPPKEIPTLEERLVSRFKWGLVAEIEPPDYETRMMIVKRKARQKGVSFPDVVCEYVADHFTGNIRELEGAIIKVICAAELENTEPNLEIARKAVKPLMTPQRRQVTVEGIIRKVCEYHGVRQADLQSKRRTKAIAYARQICMYLCRLLTNHSLEEIGGFFGGRDHTTVIYATEKIEKLRSKDTKVKEHLDILIGEIQGQS